MDNTERARALMKQAYKSAKTRGHLLTPFVTNTTIEEMEDITKRVVWRASCERCQKGVSVIINPLPNEIDVGGTAVALGCDD